MRELAAEASGEVRPRQLYDRDFLAWTQEQAEAMRRRDVGAIDWGNVIEEVETLGRSERHAWTSYCTNVISHLLRIEHYRSPESFHHWHGEIVDWRVEMCNKLEENPSMRGELPALLGNAWRRGREKAVNAMARYDAPADVAEQNRRARGWRARLPADCPYGLEDIAGYDPYVKKARPRVDAWPAPVAKALNEALGTDYPVRGRAPDRGGGRSR